MTVLPAVTLAVMLVMTLVVTGGGAILHAGEPLQVSAPSLQSYLQVSGTWSILDPTASVPLPRYAFAQVSGNTPPTVQAGGDLTVGEGNTVMLSGSATDTDGDPMTYIWSQTGPVTPRITFADASASSTTFTAPSVTGDTTFTFVLTAHDGTQPATDTLNVTVKETGAAFITTWTASDSDRNIILPLGGTYSILWGDGSHSPDVNDSQFHSYDAAGIYTVTVLGEGLENIYLYGDAANARQLRSIEQWGSTEWTYVDSAFEGAANMVYHATDTPNLSGVTSMAYMFNGASSFDGDLSDWNVSSVTDMAYMFTGASAFNGDISDWDVSSVTFMNEMFNGASSFNWPLNSWNVSSVVHMSGMFNGTTAFNQNLGTWYIVPASTDYDSGASSLDVTTISAQNSYLSGQNPIYGMGSGGDSGLFEMRGSTLAFRSAPDVGSYTANVRASGSDVFENGNNWRMLEITVHGIINNPPVVQAGGDQTVGEGDTVTLSGSATDPEDNSITYTWSQIGSAAPRITFANASASSTTFTAPSVTGDTTFTFVLTAHDGTQPATDTLNVTAKETRTAFITTWTTSDSDRDITLPLEGMYSVLWGDGSHSPDVSGSQSHSYNATGTYTVTVLGEGLERIRLFGDTPNARQLISIEQWGSTEWTSMDRAFYGAKNMVYHATDVPNLSGVTDMGSMFISNIAFNGDLSDWNVSSVTDMAYMFSSTTVFNGDLSDWNVSSVTDMSNMFSTATVFNGDLSGWDVSSVTDMSNMFSTAFDFNGDLSDWDVSSVTDMSHMFSTASDFNGDLSGWDVSSVTDMNSMFSNASDFRQNLGYWYVVLNNTSIRADDTSNVVGTISAQNQALDEQNPTYGLGTGGDSDLFVITGSTLNLNPTVDYSNKIWYSVNITSTGDFGTGNHRVYGITISDTDTTISDTAPTVTSIKRYDPAVENTNSQTLIYKVTFSEDVTGVTESDFTLSSDSAGGENNGISSVTDISGSGDVYYVTVSAAQDGTYNLDLVSSGHGIRDAANNLLNNTTPTTGTDETYTVSTTVIDTTNPRLASIERSSPTSQNTDSQSLIYKVTFSESVTGVTSSDFILSLVGSNAGTGSITGISGSGSVYYVTVSAAQDGTYNLDLVSSGHGIRDAANNLLNNTTLTTGTDETYTVSTTVIDTTNPRLASIERSSPTSQNTDSQSLIYKVTFSESVTGVTSSDFILSLVGSNAGTGSITGISGSGSVYYVTVSAAQDGTYNLDLVSSGHGIRDAANNLLNNTTPTTGTDETYTVSTTVIDTTNPRLASIERSSPTSQNTDSQSLIYKVTFSESVTGVTSSDFILSLVGSNAGTGSITGISGSGSVYYVTVSAAQDGTYNLDLVSSGHGIRDAANNLLNNTTPTTGTDETYTVSTTVIDTTNPRLASIERSSPTSQNTDSQSLIYKVTFSESVTGVTSSDFILSLVGSNAGTGSITGISGSGSVYYVTVSAAQDGTYNLDLVSSGHGIRDAANNLLNNTTPTTGTDETYTVSTTVIDTTNPRLASIERYNPASQNTTSQTLIYMATFSENVTGVDASDFILSPDSAGGTGGGSSPVTDVSGSGDVYSVTVFASTNGTYNLDLVSSGHSITDAAANPLTDTIPTSGTDHTYTVSTIPADVTAPTLASIERYSPAAENTDSQTLVYKVTFSENVTGVDTSDFTLSPDSTGNGTGSGQFTQTRTPAITIPYDQIVTDTILVTGSGTATSVFVAVDIAHQYVVDLKVDLIAPDGTVQTLHDRPDGPANIDKTYTPDFGSVSIAGNWTLQMHDDYSADDGILNSWMLTVNHDSDIATHVTSISGSGDVYYATLSAAQDGTYNLDLVSSGHSITDATANPLTDTIPTSGTDHTYTVSTIPADVTAPTLASIERYSPAAENTDSQTLVYKVTFSENVTGVDTSDFTLSPGSTGNGTGSGQFTQTRTPAITIPYDQIVTDTILVTGSGTATSVSVAVDIAHQYVVDLKVDLIAPDGTVQTLHDRPDGPANIDKTYTPDFGSVSIAGNWTLQMHDDFSADDGILNSWMLTVNHDSDIATHVTSISGSGDVYYATLSAAQDGTYNLDLVSSGHSITDAAANPLTDTIPTSGTDHTYTVSTIPADVTAPTLASIERSSPTSQNTDSQSLIYKVTFSESVTGVTSSDFILSLVGSNAGTGSITGISGSGSVYYVTVSAAQDGTYNLDLVSSGHGIRDAANNLLNNTTPTTGTDETYTVSTTVIDTTNPRLASIERSSPTSQNTDSQSLIYKVTFSESVTGVTSSDFILSLVGSNAGTGSITGISGSGSVYYVTVSAAQDGTYNLDLVSSGHGIRDAANNLLNNTTPTTGTDETYTVSTTVIDTTNPRLASIERSSPTSQNTDSQSLIYKVTFSESVTGVTSSDFILSLVGSNAGTGSITGISGSGSVYYVTVSAAQDGTYNLDLVSSGHGIRDAANNLLNNTTPTTGTDETYTVSTTVIDTTNPRLASIERSSPTSQNTDSQSLIYKVTFSESVTGVTSSDFILSLVGSNAGTGSITGISGSGSVYYVTVSAAQDGTYNLDLVSSGHGIRDAANNLLNNTTPTTGTDETYTVSTTVIDTTNPRLASIERYNPASQNTTSQSLIYMATFSENVTGVDASDFILSPDSAGGTGGGSSPVTDVSGSGDVYSVTVFASTNGTYNLDLVSSGHSITDAAANPLTDTIPTSGTDHTYTVSTIPADVTAPTLASIERYSPAAENTDSQTLVYKVTFSENVTGVDTSDFTLSPDSTGNGTGSGQFTQTRTPAITIPYDQIVTDTILVTGSGTATSVSVAVDIAHQYVVDLKVDLIAPDGTVQTLHDRPDGPANIDKTYTPDFGSVSIAGNWTLQMHDDFSADDGILNSWMLTVNHDSDIATHVTSISGSGSVYYVTVSAAQDGTYNLDLVSSGHSITDAAANPLTDTIPTSGTDETYTVSTTVIDTTNPRLASIERSSPTSQNTDSQLLIYKVTFSESVTGVASSDFILSLVGSNAGTGSITGISGSGSVYYVTVSAAQDGTYNLDLISSGHGIADTASNPLTNTATIGADQTYTVSTTVVNTTNPRLESIERYSPTSQNTDSQLLIYKATFSKSVTGVGASDFVLSPGSTGGGNNGISPIDAITGSGDTYYVIVFPAVDGTYNLDLVSSGHNIADAASNPLTNTVPITGIDQTYTKI